MLKQHRLLHDININEMSKLN